MKKQIISLIILCALPFSQVATAFCEEIVVYSARKEHLIRPLFSTSIPHAKNILSVRFSALIPR
jgi:hypothetical protein